MSWFTSISDPKRQKSLQSSHWNTFFSFFFCVPQVDLWYVTVFNQTIEVVTFRLRGCCMLGDILLPAFTRLGHERQDLLSPYDGMHVCADQTSVYTLIPEFWGNGDRTYVNSREKSPLPEKKNLLRGESTPRRCIKQDSWPNTLPKSYSGPHWGVPICMTRLGKRPVAKAGFEPRPACLEANALRLGH